MRPSPPLQLFCVLHIVCVCCFFVWLQGDCLFACFTVNFISTSEIPGRATRRLNLHSSHSITAHHLCFSMFYSYFHACDYNHKAKNALKRWQNHVLINIPEEKYIWAEKIKSNSVLHCFFLPLTSHIPVPESLEFILHVTVSQHCQYVF